MSLSIHEVADKVGVIKPRLENLDEIKNSILAKSYSNFLHLSDERSPGIHVSSIIGECMRSPCYDIEYGVTHNIGNLARFGIGHFLHDKVKVFSVQELPLEWEEIITDGVDEYDPDTGYFLDKKITWNPPTYGVFKKHVRQMENYKVMLRANKYKATEGFILYMNIANPNIFFRLRHLNKMRALKTVRKEMRTNRNIILEFEETRELPPRCIGEDCNFCGHVSRCLSEVL